MVKTGAGKTTLMNILFGQYTADAGEVELFGATLPPGAPRAALDGGVGMVHQHFTLADNLTVWENITLGVEPLFQMRLNASAARARIRSLSERFHLKVDPNAKVGRLTVGERQRVEILKALYRDARILILDEPTGRSDTTGVRCAFCDAERGHRPGAFGHLHFAQTA